MTGELKRAAERAERFNEWFGAFDGRRRRGHRPGTTGTTGKVWPAVLQLTLEGRGVERWYGTGFEIMTPARKFRFRLGGHADARLRARRESNHAHH